jgi:hypothetical protein
MNAPKAMMGITSGPLKSDGFAAMQKRLGQAKQMKPMKPMQRIKRTKQDMSTGTGLKNG